MAMLMSRLGLQRETCPYCFERYKIGGAPFRCSSPAKVCTWERDAVLDDKWKDARNVGRVLPAKSFTRSVRCNQCGHQTRKRLCPHCHIDLPPTTGDCKNLIFAVIGAKEAGKSHYIAVLIDQIRNNVGPALGILMEPLNDRTIQRYKNEFHDPVFERHQTIAGTQSALAANSTVQYPLVYALSFAGRDLLGREKKIDKTVSMVFFDTAGEDLDDQDVMSTVNKYIYRADGIILLLDPLQLTTVRDRLAGLATLPEQNTETADIVTRTTNLILSGRNLKPNAMVTTPFAVVFSKFDAVEPLIDPQFQLQSTPSHVGGFDVGDFGAVNGEMQSLLEEWRGTSVVQQVRSRYPNHGFFGLSALGCNPENNRIPHVMPRRVEDPFLWLLYRHGLVGAARGSGAR